MGRSPAHALSLLGLSALLAFPSTATADNCSTPYSARNLVSDLTAMSSALRSLDEAAFKTTGARVETNLVCIDTPVTVAVYAKAYRLLGVTHFLAGEQESAQAWFRTALEVQPAFEWDINELPLGHPLRAVYEGQREPAASEKVARSSAPPAVPDGQELRVDGRRVTELRATLDRPHVVTLVNVAENSLRGAWLIEGNAFPDSLIGGVADADDRRGRRGDDSGYQAESIERVRPPLKTPLIVLGGALIAGGAGVYGASFATAQKFESATTTEDLEHYRGVTNGLVVASALTAALGLGVEYFGITLSQGPGFTVGARF